jgi:hypothetical protein
VSNELTRPIVGGHHLINFQAPEAPRASLCCVLTDGFAEARELFHNLGVDGEEIDQRFRGAAAQTAFGRDTEVLKVMARDISARQCAVDAVMLVHEAKIDAGLIDAEIFQRSEIGVVTAADRHRHVNPIDAAR